MISYIKKLMAVICKKHFLWYLTSYQYSSQLYISDQKWLSISTAQICGVPVLLSNLASRISLDCPS
jgi:hypothetical protein